MPPTQNPTAPVSAINFRKLLFENYPPRDEQEKVYASAILALSDEVARLSKQVSSLVKGVKFLLENAAAGKDDDDEEQQQGQGQEVQRDQTPFPAGAKISPNVAPTPPPTAPPVDDAQAAASPDVGSSPPMNAAPIPKRSGQQQRNNGTKDQA